MSQKSDASQINFDLLFKNHPLPMWIYDIQSLAFLEVNNAAVKKYGYSHKKFLSITLKDIMPKEDVSRLIKDISKKRPTLQQSVNWQHKLKSGKIIDVEITSHTIDYNGRKAILVTAKDITDRKRTEETLRESEENLSITLNSIGDAVISTDNKGIIIKMNPTAEKLCGWKMYDAIGKPIDKVFKIINANNRIAIDSPFDKVIKTGKIINLANHTILISRDGLERNIADSAAPIKDSKGNIKGVVLVFSDVTEAYKTRKELHDSEQRLRESQKIARLGSYVWDLPKGLWSSSEILDDIFGIDETYIRSLEGWAALVHPDWRETMTKYVTEKVIGKRKRFDKEYKIVRIKDGEERWVHGLGELELDNKKQPVRLKGTISDITGRKRAEEALRLFRALIDKSNDAIEVLDPETGRFLDVNERGCLDLGYSREEFLSLSVFDIDPTLDQSSFKSAGEELRKSGAQLWEGIHRRKDGSTFPVEVNIKYVQFDLEYLVTVVRDITERKRTEKALQENETRYHSIVENLHQAYYEANSRSIFTYCNPELIIISGYSEQELIGISSFRLVAEEHRAHVAEAYKQWKKEKRTDMSVEFLVQKKNGEKFWVEQTSHYEFDEQGCFIKATNIVRDIHERKLVEDTLRKSEDRYRQLFENSPIGIYRTTPNGRILAANPALVRMLGCSSFEDFAHRNLEQEQDASYSRSAFKEQLDRDGLITGLEAEWYKSDKTPLLVRESTQVVRDNTGKVLYYDGTVEDITEFKKAEVALRENEERLRTIIETEPECVKVVDRDGRLLEMNAAGLAMLEAESLCEAQQHTLFNFILPEYHAPFDALHKRVMSGENGVLEFEVTGLKGTRRWLETNVAPMRNATGEVAKLLGVTRDITERKHAEEILRKSEERFRNLVENINEVFYISNGEGKIEYCSPNSFTSIGYSLQDILRKSYLRLIAPIDRRMVADYYLEQTLNGSSDSVLEFRVRCKDGTIIWVEQITHFVRDATGNIVEYRNVARNITERKQAEEALRESHQFIEGIINAIPVRVFWKDKNLVYLGCNVLFARDAGFVDPKEIVGNDDYKMVWHDQAELYRADDRSVIETGRSKLLIEELQTTPEGNNITLLTSKIPLRNISGEIVGILGSYLDITERKQVETELRKSQEDLLKFFEDDISADFITTPSGKLLQCNRTFLKLFGFNSKEEALAFPIEKLYSVPSDRNRFIDLLKKNKKIENFESKLLSLDGRIIYTIENAACEFDKAGELIQIRGYIVDITNRKKAEEELRKLSIAVEQGPVSVVITNHDGDIEYVNEKFCEVTGYSKEEVFGKNPRILKSNHHDEKFYADLWSTLLSGKDWKGEMLNKKKNGNLFWESVMLSPLVTKEGDITHFVAVKEDITEKKMMVEDLIEAIRKAESSNKLKDAFIANMSHEIRTPLNGILGLSEIIKDMYAEYIKVEDEELFAGIEHSSKRIIRTIDMILNYSRIQTGEFPVAHRKIELSSICDNLVTEFTNSAKSKLLKLSFENRCSKTATIFCDEYSITHAISNLIDNAIKYTNKGIIDVIVYNGNNDEILLDIKDSGIGISEDYIQHIFEPYQQEQIGYGRTYEGVGLGLPIVKKFLLLNNAGISVKSTKEKGTVFTVNFGKTIYPSEEKKITEKFIDNITSSVRKSIPSVLIVEDDKINQLTIEKFIESSYRTISTDSSDVAIELLKKNKVDLILVDISIRGSMNGLELTKELKASKEYSGIPVIAITAHAF